MTKSTMLNAVLTGKAVPFGRPDTLSAIGKHPVDAAIAIGPAGLEGDEQADRRNHGGPDKAIHHYPFDHYAAWRGDLPAHCPLLESVGAFGENLSTLGLTEETVCIGDIFRIGTATVQVSQGRQPCWKLNHRFGVKDMARRCTDRPDRLVLSRPGAGHRRRGRRDRSGRAPAAGLAAGPHPACLLPRHRRPPHARRRRGAGAACHRLAHAGPAPGGERQGGGLVQPPRRVVRRGQPARPVRISERPEAGCVRKSERSRF